MTASDNITKDRIIVLHEVSGDPEHSRLTTALAVASYLDLPRHTFGDAISDAASALGMDAGDFAAVLGLALEVDENTQWVVIPDGERACYFDECTHGNGYVLNP